MSALGQKRTLHLSSIIVCCRSIEPVDADHHFEGYGDLVDAA